MDQAPTAGSAPLSDEDLVVRIVAGERALFEVLMRRHNQRLFRTVRAVLRDDSEVDEVLQHAWLAAFSHLARFEGRARFGTWLTRIALHEAWARGKRRQRRAEVPLEEGDSMHELSSATPSPEQQLASREIAGVLESAVDALPELYRVVFMLREIDGRSTAETAECLELSEEAVKVRLHRARAQIRERIVAAVGEASARAFVFLGPRCDQLVAAVLGRLAETS